MARSEVARRLAGAPCVRARVRSRRAAVHAGFMIGSFRVDIVWRVGEGRRGWRSIPEAAAHVVAPVQAGDARPRNALLARVNPDGRACGRSAARPASRWRSAWARRSRRTRLLGTPRGLALRARGVRRFPEMDDCGARGRSCAARSGMRAEGYAELALWRKLRAGATIRARSRAGGARRRRWRAGARRVSRSPGTSATGSSWRRGCAAARYAAHRRRAASVNDRPLRRRSSGAFAATRGMEIRPARRSAVPSARARRARPQSRSWRSLIDQDSARRRRLRAVLRPARAHAAGRRGPRAPDEVAGRDRLHPPPSRRRARDHVRAAPDRAASRTRRVTRADGALHRGRSKRRSGVRPREWVWWHERWRCRRRAHARVDARGRRRVVRA